MAREERHFVFTWERASVHTRTHARTHARKHTHIHMNIHKQFPTFYFTTFVHTNWLVVKVIMSTTFLDLPNTCLRLILARRASCSQSLNVFNPHPFDRGVILGYMSCSPELVTTWGRPH